LRIVLITGATSGFGKLMTQTFLAHGDLVVATGRNLKQRREIFEEEREKFGDRLVEFDLDVRNEHQVLEVANIIEEKFSSLDILINNAGYGLFGALEDFSNEQIKEQMDVNFYGTVLVTRSFLPLLRKKKGKIFNFSSDLILDKFKDIPCKHPFFGHSIHPEPK
jgi:NAD(P)-dependent dehydrogenase (short-subunit alcohol dehydrogenase family)